MTALRVLHVLTHSPAAARGGIETYVRQIVAEQQLLGIVPRQLVTDPAAPLQPKLVADVVAVRPRMPLDLLEECAHERRLLADALVAADCHLVHVHHWHHLGSDVVRTARALGLQVVLTLHDFFAVCPQFFRLRGTELCLPDVELATCTACVAELAGLAPEALAPAMAAWSRAMPAELQAASRVLALSRAHRDMLCAIPRLAGIRIDVIDLPPPPCQPSPIQPYAVHGPMRLVTWGGLVPGKGLALLIDACARLPFAVEVHHYGRIVDAEFAERLQRGSAVPLVVHGPFASGTSDAELAAFDVAVFPSHFAETYGYVVDEAMQLGLPVVVSDHGAPPERVGSRGLVFRAGDAGALAAALVEAQGSLEALRAGEPRFLATPAGHAAALHAVYREVMVGGTPATD